MLNIYGIHALSCRLTPEPLRANALQGLESQFFGGSGAIPFPSLETKRWRISI